MPSPRQYRAGQSVEDHCRQCHEDRIHTVIVVDAHAQPLRVACDYCRSEHNYRGGPRLETRSAVARGARAEVAPRAKADHSPLPLVSERERQAPPMSHNSDTDLELLIRRIIRE